MISVAIQKPKIIMNYHSRLFHSAAQGDIFF
jgi:hypothetical protein